MTHTVSAVAAALLGIAVTATVCHATPAPLLLPYLHVDPKVSPGHALAAIHAARMLPTCPERPTSWHVSTGRALRRDLEGELPPPPSPTSAPYSDAWWEETLDSHYLDFIVVSVTSWNRDTGMEYWLLPGDYRMVKEQRWIVTRCSG